MQVNVQTKLDDDTIRLSGSPPAGLKKLIGQQVIICIQPAGKIAGVSRSQKLTGGQLRRAGKKYAAAQRRKRAAGLVDEEYTAECRAAVAARPVVTAEQARQDTAGIVADLTALIRADRRGG